MTSSVLNVPNVQVTHVALNRIRITLSVNTTPDDLTEFAKTLRLEPGTTAEVVWLGAEAPEMAVPQLASCIQSEFGAEVTHVDMRLEVGAKLLSGLYEIPVSLGHQAPDNALPPPKETFVRCQSKIRW